MNADRIKDHQKAISVHQSEIEAIITNALLETYKSVTGKKASQKTEDAIAEAIRYELL